ncbi:MAG: cyanophycinase, partial [Gemmatimonadota bacterium]|nr:cyanophycinase [Gemmatimonadota bacterium]
MSPSPSSDGTRGHIIPIGGAEDRTTESTILHRFVDLCGGRDARIAIIPTASTLGDTGNLYLDAFKALGAGRSRVLPYVDRHDTDREDWLGKLNQATGIFLTGGNQLRLSTVLGGTPVATAIRRRNAAGVHVAGTSAGAGFLSEHMIAYGEEGFNPKAEMVTMAAGLGLTNRVIVDQHFRQRDRLGRIFTALSGNPFAVGIGLDEDTAAFIGPDNE